MDGRSETILHVSQVASLLGLPQQATAVAERVAWDTVTILRSWTTNLDLLDSAVVVQPTLSRERTIRNLTVNTFHPFQLLPAAFDRGSFDWYPERDSERERDIPDVAALQRYATQILGEWELFVFEHGAGFDEPNLRVKGPRGDIGYPALLDSQRWHAAWHHRQVADHCQRQGMQGLDALPASLLQDVGLPAYVY